MESIRRNVFETNSSSTHSITMCSESEYEKWKKGELFYHRWDEKFFTKEEIIEKAKEKREKYLKEKEEGKTLYHYMEQYINAETDEDLLKVEMDLDEEDEGDGDYYSYERFWNYIESQFETFENSYTTETNETVIAFGYYGYDG